MRYLSVCSGIEAATVAWSHMGWEAAGFSEIEPFPSAVLKHHYPAVHNFGDMTKYREWDCGTIDLLVGGTPCQSFSVAGLRKGLDDPRGNLALTYCGILDRFKPKWFVWENVPGVLSSNGGRDFGSFLGAVAQLGYGFAYRVLDAQYFGVAQRRRRVFVVGCLGDWRSAAEVLFEPESLSGNPAPSREKRQEVAGTSAESSGIGSRQKRVAIGNVNGGSLTTLSSREYKGLSCGRDGMTSAAVVYEPVAIQGNLIGRDAGGPQGVGVSDEVMYTLTKADVHGVANGMAVRRLTPVECERLQGFPDNYTNIPWRKSSESPDGPRYKALGNSMAVPVMKWIGERINGR